MNQPAASPKYAISFGEVLFDRLPPPQQALLGGAPANFAFHLKKLGFEVFLVSRVGADQLGQRALRELAAAGLDPRYLQTDHLFPTGTVDVTLGAGGVPAFTINRDAAYDRIEDEPQLEQLAAGSTLICYGTLCQRAEQSRTTLRRLLARAPGALKLLDINLRRDCYSDETIRDSLEQADILKLNSDEMAALTDSLALKVRDASDFAGQMVKRFNLKVCVITFGADGCLAVSSQGAAISKPGYKVEVEDTIGSGDAFTAAFIYRYLAGASLAECAEYGNRLGALVAGRKGAMPDISSAELDTFTVGK